MPLCLSLGLLYSYVCISFDTSMFLQYIHGLAARGVHYIHRPGPTLQDLGYILLPVRLQVLSSMSLGFSL